LRLDAGREEALSTALHKAFDKIPKDAGVYCPHRFSAYLSNRQNMVMGDLRDEDLDFKAMINNRFSITNVSSKQIKYIVCDLLSDQCGWVQDDFNQNVTNIRIANVNRLTQSGQWQLRYNQDNVIILQRIED